MALLAGAGAARAEDAEKARQLFQEGSKYYDVGQFDRAIEAWQQGYDQKPDPSFLYNIAQAYRQKEDPAKSIFFYKSYLRNSPNAKNRVEVEGRIAALQKQLDSGVKAATPPGTSGTMPPPSVTAPPPVTPPPATTAPVTTTPPPVATEPPPAPTQPPPPDFAPGAPAAAVATGPEPSVAGMDQRWDVGAAIGSDFWSSGVQGTADPSFAFTLSAGYRWGSPASRFRFRLGALFGYTFLSEAASKETFLSFLIDPTLEVRLDAGGRWLLAGDLGLGFMSIGGLKSTSALLDPPAGQMLVINGAQALSLTRVGVALQFRVRPDLMLFAGPAINGSPKKEHFHAPITRFETTVGLAYRF